MSHGKTLDGDALRALPVRLVAWAAAGSVVVTLPLALITDHPGLFGWVVAATLVAAAAIWQLFFDRAHPPALAAISATIITAAAPFSAADPAPALGAGILVATVVAVGLYESLGLNADRYLVWTSLMTAVLFWTHHPGWLTAISVGVMFVSLWAARVILRAGTRALERTRLRYQTLFEHGADPLLAVGTGNRIDLVNAAACRAFGYSQDELVGRPLSDLLPHCTFSELEERIESGGILQVEGRRRSGDLFPADVTATSLDTATGRFLIVTIRDITSRVEAEGLLQEQERVYRDLFDGVPIGLYRTTTDGMILDANPALADILGYDDPRDLVGVTAGDFYVATEERSRIQHVLHDMVGRPATVEMQLRRRNGDVIWVRDHVRAVAGANGRVDRYEGAMRDVTDEKRAFTELENEIRSKTELIAAVSHELRTPLTAVVGFIDVLLSNQGLLDTERDELLALAGEQATDLALLIEDLLTSAHIEQDQLIVAPETTGLHDCVALAMDTLRSKQLGEVRNEVPAALTAWADAARLRQIVRNLLGNGLIHGGPPVTVSARRIDGGDVEMVVADRGDGIPDELADRIFESFFRGNRGTTPGSIGLGLAVSRRLARHMGGDLEYRRRDGLTEFVLVLPGRRPAASGAEPSLRPVAAPGTG